MKTKPTDLGLTHRLNQPCFVQAVPEGKGFEHFLTHLRRTSSLPSTLSQQLLQFICYTIDSICCTPSFANTKHNLNSSNTILHKQLRAISLKKRAPANR